jgi:MFS family permease
VGSLRRLPRAFYVLLAITLLFMAGNSSDAFLILRGKDLGLSTSLVVLAYVVYNVVYAALAIPAGEVSDRLPRQWVLAAGYAVFAAVYLGFAVASSDGAAWPLFAVYGASIALTDGVSKALISDYAQGDIRSTALGLFQGLAGLAALAASVTAGVLWDQVSVRAPFFFGASCAAAATVAMVAFAATAGPSAKQTQPGG